MAKGYIRVKSNILRRLNGPDTQQTPLSAGLLSEGSGAQTATDAGGNFRDILSVNNHQSHPTPHTQGSFSFSQDNRWPQVKITKVRSGGVKPASNIFTRSSLQGGNSFNGWQNRKNDYSLQRKEENTANSYNYLSQNWDQKYAKISSHKENILSRESTRHFLKVDKDKSLGNSIYSNFFPWQTNKLQQAQPLTPTGHNGDYKETNQRPTVRVLSGWSNFRSPAVPHESTLGDRDPNQDTIPTVTEIPQNQISVGRGEKLGHKNVQSYFLKDSLTQANSLMSDGQDGRWMDAAKLKGISLDTQEKSKLDPDFKQLPRINPTKQKSSDQKPSFPKHWIRIYSSQHTPTSPPQAHLYPASVEGKNLESFVPKILLNSQDGSATRSKTFTSLGRINSTSSESVFKFKPQQFPGRISRLRGFTNPVKQPSGPSKILNFQQSNLDKGINYRFKFSNMNSFLSPKYSFGQRVSTTTTPAELEKTDGSSPTPEIQSASTSEIVTTSFKPTQQLQSERDISKDRNSTETRFRLYKESFGLKGLDSRPLEGARALRQGLDVSSPRRPDFKGFKLRSLQPWQAKRIRIHRQYNQAGESEPSSSNITTVSPIDLRGKEFELIPETPGNNGSTSRSTSYKTPMFLIHRPVKNRISKVQSKTSQRYLEQNPTRSSDVVSSFLRSGHPKVPTKPEVEPSQANKTKLISIEKQTTVPKTSTTNTVRGKRVKETNSRKLTGYTVFNTTGNVAILRQSRVQAVTYADILGSASFSSIRATSPTQVTLTGEDHLSNTTTTEPKEMWTVNSEHGRNISTNPEANITKDTKDFRSVEQNEVGKDEETDEGLKTPDLFFDNEGSGDVDLFDFLALLIKHQAAGKDLLELDYLRKSTGNVTFKSVRRSDSTAI